MAPPAHRCRPATQAGRTSRTSLSLALVLLVACSACYAKKRFEQATLADTPHAYRSFIESYPRKKKYVQQAEARLEELRFEEARAEDTYAAWRAFTFEFPYGRFTKIAELRAQDLRAEELDVVYHRGRPADYHTVVTSRGLPYRIQVRALGPEDDDSRRLETRWFEELHHRDLFVPLDPRESYTVSPQIVLRVRESVIYLASQPTALMEAEAWVGNEKVREYRVAGLRPEVLLPYEIFQDAALYESLLQPSEEEREAVRARFEAARTRLPLPQSISLEFDIPQRAPTWDAEVTRGYVRFLEQLPLSEDFVAYPRGRPPKRIYDERLYFRVDPDIHAPSIRSQWSATGPERTWTGWTTKQIAREPTYFYEKMTLDLLEFLDALPDSQS